MHRITSAALAGALVWSLWQGIQVQRLKEKALDLGEEIAVVEKQRQALLARARGELTVSPAGAIAPEPLAVDLFEPLDIPLDHSLQLFTYQQSLEQGIDPMILFMIMEHESRFQVDAIGFNNNGTTDIGLCQINSVNWTWLAEEGIDVHTPQGNIRAAIRILTLHLEDYPMEQALAAYAVGQSGMEQGGGQWFAEEILTQYEAFAA